MSIFTLRIQRECDIVCFIAPTIGSRSFPDFIVRPLFYIRLFRHIIILIVSGRLAVVIDGSSPFGFSIGAFHSELIPVVCIITVRQTSNRVTVQCPDSKSLLIEFDLFLRPVQEPFYFGYFFRGKRTGIEIDVIFIDTCLSRCNATAFNQFLTVQ